MADSTGGEVTGSTSEQQAPPLPHRRPRVREVSSRFMTPLIHSNSSPVDSDFPRSKSVQRRLLSKTDENHIPDINRSFVKSPGTVLSTVHRKHHQKTVKQHTKEHGEGREHHHSNVRVSSRSDTPIAVGTDRIVSSRYRQASNTPIYRSNSLNSSSNGYSAVTAANRLLQDTFGVEKKFSRIQTSSRDDSDTCSTTTSIQGSSSCPNSPLFVPISKQRSVADPRFSMPDVDKWLADRNCQNAGKMNDCARSLNFPSSMKVGGNTTLPPHPLSCMRSGFDVKKGRNLSSHLEDEHSLKLLISHYQQWRFANAKAEACVRAQKQEAERKLYSLGCKLSEIRDSVNRKRSELAVLRGINTLKSIVESQMPYLDDWSNLEEDYSNSLSCTTNAMLNCSARLPVSGNVRADAGELREAMSSALKVVESIESNIERFAPKAEEMDISVSELARMLDGEKSLIEECEYMLSKTYSSQVTECSLRGTLMQLHNSNNHHQGIPNDTKLQSFVYV